MMCRTAETSAAAASGESTSIWIIVGTSRVSVTRCSAIVARAPAGEKAVTNTWVTPTQQAAGPRARSARWNIGAACISRPPGVMNSPEATHP